MSNWYDEEPYPPPTAPRRCRKCYYVIDHLGESGLCPECGTRFNIYDPWTYTTKPPFVWWTFWLPGLVTAFISGMGLYLVLIPMMGFTWSTVIAVPAATGVILGYRTQGCGVLAMVLLGLVVLVALIMGLASTSLVGVYCGLVMEAIGILPMAAGVGVGVVLRSRLKMSNFSQRAHLPTILLATAGLALIEGRHGHLGIVATSTSVAMNVSPERAWEAIQFYEQVKHPPPLLLRITPTFRPVYTTGRSAKVGDVKTCVYEHGRLRKQITDVEPGKRLAFRVIEQTEIQTRGVRLIDGSFEFEPTSDGGTKVTLTTRYQPLLEPRIAFLPAESLAVHTLHGHVLRGMTDKAEQAERH